MTRSSEECDIAADRKSDVSIDINIVKKRQSEEEFSVHPTKQKNKFLRHALAQVGSYKVKTKVGYGASGKVKRITDRSGEQFAMKVVPYAKHKDPAKSLDRLRNEAECLHRCQGHESIVRLEEAMMNKKNFFLVTELAEGGDVFDHIRERGPMPEEEARRMFKQLISAVQHMHKRGVGHRDIKPENVLYYKDNVKLCDFGFAVQWHEGDDLLGNSLGTVRCLPPEMIKTPSKREPKHNPFAADVWSCGILFFFLLSARFPFDGNGQSETLKNICKVKFTRKLPSHVSPMAKDLLSKILCADPKKRFTSDDVLNHPYFSNPLPHKN